MHIVCGSINQSPNIYKEPLTYMDVTFSQKEDCYGPYTLSQIKQYSREVGR